jgi:D-tyrosyl-tRNA(Tyr) deacylase
VLQRVKSALVSVGGQEISSIGLGLCIFVGFCPGDGDAEIDWLVQKTAQLRIFEDGQGKMNLSLEDVGGEALFVSQFTLYADLKKSGRRPSFSRAMPYSPAQQLFGALLRRAAECGLPAKGGAYGADMLVSLENEGPVTILLEHGQEG